MVLVGLLLYSDEMAEVRYIDRVKQKITLTLNSSRYKSLKDVTSAIFAVTVRVATIVFFPGHANEALMTIMYRIQDN